MGRLHTGPAALLSQKSCASTPLSDLDLLVGAALVKVGKPSLAVQTSAPLAHSTYGNPDGSSWGGFAEGS